MKEGRLQRTAFFTGEPETVRVLGLRIDFATDSLGSLTTTPDGKFDMRNGRSLGIVIDPPPHDRKFFMSHLEALRRYWKFASYGHLVIEYDVYPKADSTAYRLADTGRYGPWTIGQESFDSAARFFHDAVTVADQTDSIPFGRFDVVTLFHAGSDFQTDLAGDSPRDFPTFQITLGDSVPVNGGAVSIRGSTAARLSSRRFAPENFAPASSSPALVAIGVPLTVAPRPAIDRNNSSVTGAKSAAMIGRPPLTSAAETAQSGRPAR